MEAVKLTDVWVIIDRKVVLEGVNFWVEEGDFVGIIGPNGAGKTTLLRVILGLIEPARGSVWVYGFPPEKGRRWRVLGKFISYIPEEAGAYRNMSGIEYLRFVAGFYEEDVEEMVKRAVEISGLGDRIKDKVATYSKGMVRKLLLARALMVQPKLAILDEPTSGLDVLSAREVRKMLKESTKNGLTILLSSHNMLEVEFLCDRIALIYDGRIVEEGTPTDLKERYGATNIEEVFEEVVKCSGSS